MPDVTRDALFAGAVSIVQPARRRGYRVNADAILLAAFAARGRTARHAVDLGSGVGAVGLSLVHYAAATRVTMIEVDAALAALAEENASANGWTERIAVIVGDVRSADRARIGPADLVVCNPPYVVPGRGRVPRATVRGAKYGELDGFVDAARRLAGRRARACFVYPAAEAVGLLARLRAGGLEPKRLRAVHGRPGDPARVLLVECVPGKPGGLTIEPPFVETDSAGRRSAAAAALFRGNGMSG